MANRSRSRFESMVFQNANTGTGSTDDPVSSVFAWMQQLKPSQVSEADGVYDSTIPEQMREYIGPSGHKRKIGGGVVVKPFAGNQRVERGERMFNQKMETEHLFEVVVMYLFNGLRSYQTAEATHQTDTMSLLHYMAYIIPEADKLHVVDRDATQYEERMKHVSVEFDPIDYRFRVVVKKHNEPVWYDICIELRRLFKIVIKSIVTLENKTIRECWVPIVSLFRKYLVNLITAHTNVEKDKVDNWVLDQKDIQWETTTYGAGDVLTRNLIHETNSDEDFHEPFIISYWADNYLDFENYKMARMFNGLVGYGEFLYTRDNNYSKNASNNFYMLDKDLNKTWLWKDLAVISHDLAVTDTIATAIDRRSVLEAVIEGGTVAVTSQFKEMVNRRHVETIDSFQSKVNDLLDLFWFSDGHVEAGPGLQSDMFQQLNNHSDQQMDDLFPSVGVQPTSIINHRDGLLDSDILQKLCRSFTTKIYELAHAAIHGMSHAYKGRDIPANIADYIKIMMKTFIHIAREKWLLQHVGTIPTHVIETIQASYKHRFWNPDIVTPVSMPKPAHTQWVYNNVTVKNNSSLKDAYKDPAITTRAVGYTHAAKRNKLPSDAYSIDFSADVLQQYYDRKLDKDGLVDFMGSCDMTSILRNTHMLVKGLDTFITTIESAGVHKKGQAIDTLRMPKLQTTRTPFQANGHYYVLEGKRGLYGNVENKNAGKRATHSDDVLTFANIMFTVVDNPGIWNMLNSACGNSESVGGEDRLYRPQIANNGFVGGGYEIMDAPTADTSAEKKDTWKEIAQMTYTKLRVGVMDQPSAHISSKDYVHGVLNSTRHMSTEEVDSTFSSFMNRLYRKPGFVKCFKSVDANATHEDEMEEEEDTLTLEQEIETDALSVVENLHSRCKDGGLDPYDPTKPNYAFKSLHKSNTGIKMPIDKHKQLFYILFGETLSRLADDLDKAEMLAQTEPQMLQQQSIKQMAKHIRARLPKFLENLTQMFFDGSLHRSLGSQLGNKRRTIQVYQLTPSPHLDMRKLTFDKLVMDPMTMLCRIRTFRASYNLQTIRWNSRFASSAVAEDRIQARMARQWSVAPPATGEGPEADLRALRKDELHARLTFQPYVETYEKLLTYFRTGLDYRAGACIVIPNLEMEKLFNENRMLVTRICEENMHTIVHHYSHGEDYRGSMAWELLFDLFLHCRQKFAEITFRN